MKTSVISDEFRQRYLSNPKDPNAFEAKASSSTGRRTITRISTIRSSAIDENTILFIRGCRSARLSGRCGGGQHARPELSPREERALAALRRRWPPVRYIGFAVDPQCLAEAAAGGGLAILKNGDRVRIDLNKGTCDVLLSDAEIAKRRADLEKAGGLQGARKPDAVAGDLPGQCRPAGRRHGAQGRNEVPAHREAQGNSARQSLSMSAAGHEGQEFPAMHELKSDSLRARFSTLGARLVSVIADGVDLVAGGRQRCPDHGGRLDGRAVCGRFAGGSARRASPLRAKSTGSWPTWANTSFMAGLTTSPCAAGRRCRMANRSDSPSTRPMVTRASPARWTRRRLTALRKHPVA